MAAINRLPTVSELSGSDLLPVFSTSIGTDSGATLALLASWLQQQLTTSGGLQTQYASPNATGFGVAVAPATAGANVHLLLTPLAGYAAGTVTLPALASSFDGQEVLVTCTQAVATLTVSGNGATVNGAPTSLAANGFFRLRFDQVNASWYRIG